LELRDAPSIVIINQSQEPRCGKPAITEQAQSRCSILLPIGPEQRRMPVDEFLPYNRFGGQSIDVAGFALALYCDKIDFDQRRIDKAVA
jgi:hypothetical protein